MDDPDMGHWVYAYNGFGELVTQETIAVKGDRSILIKKKDIWQITTIPLTEQSEGVC